MPASFGFRLPILLRALLILWAGAALAGLARPAAAAQTAEPVTPAQFWALAAETRAALSALPESATSASQAERAALAARWAAIRLVTGEDGRPMPVDTSEIVRLLNDPAVNNTQALRRISRLQEFRRVFAGPRHSTADLQPLAELLRQSEYQWEPPAESPIQAWFSDLLRRFLIWLARLFPQGDNAIFSPGVDLILTLLGAGLIAAAAWLLLRGSFGELVAEDSLPAGADGRPLNPAAALDMAQAFARRGDYRQAVRYLYLSTLLALDERGLLRYDRTRTNREYLASLAGNPALRQDMDAVVETFDRVWYGYETVDQKSYSDFAERVRRVEGER